MPEFIVNPRRAPRAPARCRAAVVWRASAFGAETEDIGARGCQVVSPALVTKGDTLEVVITDDKVAGPLRAAGRAAWVSALPPWRVGIAFDDAYVASGERWFEKLVAANPGFGSFRRVPEKIPVDAMVYLGTPPRYLLDFTAEEASLLRAIASGVRLDELKARLRRGWPDAERALFSLLARQAVTLERGRAAHPDAWKKILTEVEASLAVESLGTGPIPSRADGPQPATPPLPMDPVAAPLPPPAAAAPPAAGPAASPWGTPARDPHPLLELGEPGPPLDVAPPAPRGAARAEPGAGWTTRPAPDPGGAGIGDREPALERGAEAQSLYERALAAVDAGDVPGAIALLRRALALAPGDFEIAAVLGRLAFRDLSPGPH